MVNKFWLKSYDSHVKPTLNYTSDDLGTILTNNMKEFPDKIGIYFMDAVFTYREVLDYSQRFATFLQKKLDDYVYPQIKSEPFWGKNIKKLQGYSPDTWRYRIGKFRLFYIVDKKEKIIFIITIDNRKDAYK